MSSKATITLILLGKLQNSLAAPAAGDNNLGSSQSLVGSSFSQSAQCSVLAHPVSSDVSEHATSVLKVFDIETLLLSPPQKPSSDTTTLQSDRQNSFSTFTSYSHSNTGAASATRLITYGDPHTAETTITITEKVPTTVTVSATPVTITEILLPPPTPPPTTSASASPSRTYKGLGPAKSIWVAPTDSSDLSAFRVSKFAGGFNNLEIVYSVPAKASISNKINSDEGKSRSLLQLFFPAGSIAPGTKPQGGAEFYASPINISSARNVTLQYSVLFPSDFDWVLAGKLPGLYGGHTGCSGGDPAVDCFSTRLMWREGGAGELYLYAPKDKQTGELCQAPGSVCDQTYGLSIGRGSFYWKLGGWTKVRQTVLLNTPGKQDGVFMLDVDGKRVVSRKDILYRDAKRKTTKSKTTTTTTKRTTTTAAKATTSSNTGGDDSGGLLGLVPLLGGLVGDLGRRHEIVVAVEERSNIKDAVNDNVLPVGESPPSMIIATTRAAGTKTTTAHNIDLEENWPRSSASTSLTLPSPEPTAHTMVLHPTQTTQLQHDVVVVKPSSMLSLSSRDDRHLSRVNLAKDSDSSQDGEDVGFVGIFFSTFFGGHDDKYATPRDQYIWFKDFSLAYNS